MVNVYEEKMTQLCPNGHHSTEQMSNKQTGRTAYPKLADKSSLCILTGQGKG